jgi:hypothetical protein
MGENGIQQPLEETVLVSIFKDEVRAWAEKIEVEPTNIIVRPMTRKWASCSSKGNLSFDNDLLHQPAEVRRKVIVHELLHLRYPNHNKLFRAMEKKLLEEG